MAIYLSSIVCPGCAEQLQNDNRGCPHCGYEDNERGQILPIGDIAKLTGFPESGASRFNDVNPKFIAAVIEAAQNEMSRLNQGVSG